MFEFLSGALELINKIVRPPTEAARKKIITWLPDAKVRQALRQQKQNEIPPTSPTDSK